jgi:hypothetical protein
MIYAVVVFLVAGQPVAGFRSRDGFRDLAACEAFLATEAAVYEAVRADLAHRTGLAVAVDATCRLLPAGVAS